MTTTQASQVSTIDINALEWFDKINGNSYFAGEILINYGMPNCQRLVMPYQYGYGDSYINEAIQTVKQLGLVPNVSNYELRDMGIIIRNHKKTNCKKSELKNI